MHVQTPTRSCSLLRFPVTRWVSHHTVIYVCRVCCQECGGETVEDAAAAERDHIRREHQEEPLGAA